MTRFDKIYTDYRYKRELAARVPKYNSMNREGYGYIKRRVGLLSNELDSPTYLALTELADFSTKDKAKS